MKKSLFIAGLIILFLLIFIIIYSTLAQKPVIAPTNVTDIPKGLIQSPSPISFVGKEDIYKNALNLYILKKEEGLDMSKGPCLGTVADDWVLDIAHSPRQAVDDKIENQCAEYRSGQAHHFIELDPDGKLLNSN